MNGYTTERLAENIRNYARGRADAVQKGAETPAFAALLLQKYGYGIIESAAILQGEEKRADNGKLYHVLEQEVVNLDPEWLHHAHQRWDAKQVDVAVGT